MPPAFLDAPRRGAKGHVGRAATGTPGAAPISSGEMQETAMTTPAAITVVETDLDAIASHEGTVAILVPAEGTLDPGARRVDRQTRGAVKRAVASDAFAKLSDGQAMRLAFPDRLAAEALLILRLPRRCDADLALRGGARLAQLRGDHALLILAGSHGRAAGIAHGAALRGYAFADHKTGDDAGKPAKPVTAMVAKPDAARDGQAKITMIARQGRLPLPQARKVREKRGRSMDHTGIDDPDIGH